MTAPTWLATVAGTLGVGYRLWLTLIDVPVTNSDEATAGLAALHIAAGTDFPVFFYGQHYMGAIGSYLSAPLVALLGPTVLALRLPSVLLYALFLVIMYRLATRLYSPWLATGCVALLSLGSDRVVRYQLIAGGGYPEIVPAGGLAVLLAVGIAAAGPRVRPRAYLGWGLVVGFCIWDDWLALPYLAVGLALIVWARGRELRGRAGMALLGGVFVGAAPLIVDNILAPAGQNSITVFFGLSRYAAPSSLVDRLHGGVVLGIPISQGMCSPEGCRTWQLGWSGVILALLVISAVAATRRLRAMGSTWRPRTHVQARSSAARQAGRLGLAVAALMSVALYAVSAAAANDPPQSARYLACVLISMPAVLWPLWWAVNRRRPLALRGFAALGLAAMVATMVGATVAMIQAAPARTADAQAQRDLLAALAERDLSRVYSDYWTCNWVTYLSDERVVCAVLDEHLRPGLDRYEPYRTQVASADRPTYVLRVGGVADRTFQSRLAALGLPVAPQTVAGYHLYSLAQAAGVPDRSARGGQRRQDLDMFWSGLTGQAQALTTRPYRQRPAAKASLIHGVILCRSNTTHNPTRDRPQWRIDP
jgi:hypothetical protein